MRRGRAIKWRDRIVHSLVSFVIGCSGSISGKDASSEFLELPSDGELQPLDDSAFEENPDSSAILDEGPSTTDESPVEEVALGDRPGDPSCVPESDQALCGRFGKNCGTLLAVDECGEETRDNCGSPRTVFCGSCVLPETCGGGGVANVCAAATDPPVDPQYLVFHKSPPGDPSQTCCSWYWQDPTTITQGGIDEIVSFLNQRKGSANRKLGFSFTIPYLEAQNWQEEESLKKLLCLSKKTDTPVLVKLDGFNWWENRWDLWNFWDPSLDGYNPENKDNVEWTSWNRDDAIKISWRNWGRQIRVKPHPNIGSAAYQNAVKSELQRLVPIVSDWYRNLPTAKKYLFAGLVVSWELSIGVGFVYYPNGNGYLNQDPANDPVQAFDVNQLDGGFVQLGYAALTHYGIQNSGTITLDKLNHAIYVHALWLTNEVSKLGIPRNKLFLHGLGKPFGFSAMTAYAATPGWSFYDYAYNPAQATDGFSLPLGSTLDLLDDTPWGAVEWLYTGSQSEQNWKSALDNTFGYRNNKMIVVYNWEGVSHNTYALPAFQAVLDEAPGCWLSPALISSQPASSQVTLLWLPPANLEKVYLNISDNPARLPSGGIQDSNVLDQEVTGSTSLTRSLTPGSYYWQIVVDGCGGTQRRISYDSFVVP